VDWAGTETSQAALTQPTHGVTTTVAAIT
jgi:hypothetical protein